MKRFLTAVFLNLCAATANAAYIYNVDRTIGDFTLAGTIETSTNNGVLNTTFGPMPDISAYSLTLSGATFSYDVTNIFISGDAVSATPTELLYDFTTGENGAYLLFSTGVNLYGWCFQTSTGCDSNADTQSEFIIYNDNVLATQGHAGEVVAFAAAVPVPAAIWLFGSGLIGLAGFARRKR